MVAIKPPRKLGRNEPCWCNSGKKYKRCHLDEVNQIPQNRWEREKTRRKFFSNKQCLAPNNMKQNCSGRIIQAHTVPIGISLQHIAIDKHVLGYKPSLKSLDNNGGRIKPESIGIWQASTFNGFCRHHDKSLFECVEDEPITFSLKQCVHMAFRVAAKELYTKESALRSNSLLRDSDKDLRSSPQTQRQTFISSHQAGLEAGLRDITRSFNTLSEAVYSGVHASVSSIIFEFDDIFPVMFAGGHTPEIDLFSRRIQDVGNINVKTNHIFATALKSDNGSSIAISWIKENKCVGQLLSQQLETFNQENLPSLLLQLAIQSFENCYYSPLWYNQLSPDIKEHLIRLSMVGISPFTTKIKLRFDFDFKLPKILSIRRVN